jgi:hypothetical protein
MNFQQLLQQRDDLLRQARLANLAFAYERLGTFAARIARARLPGLVILRPGDPDGDEPWPALKAVDGSQAVLEEYFLEEEIVELADILGFLGERLPTDGLRLRLEELEGRYMPLLQRELQAAGVELNENESPAGESGRGRS